MATTLAALRQRFPFKAPEGVVDHLVIGGGVVGLAVAARLSQCFPEKSTYLVERHQQAGQETSSRNSEVIHAGIYYPADSFKTKLCIRGRELLYSRCEARGIGHQKLGKLVIATSPAQQSYLTNLHAHTHRVGVPTSLMSGAEARELEPDLTEGTVAALWSRETGIVDSHGLMESFEQDIQESEPGELVYGTSVVRIDPWRPESTSPGEGADRGYVVQTLTEGSGKPDVLLARCVINSAGLNAHTIMNHVLPPDQQRELWFAKGSWCSYKGPGVSHVQRLLYPCPEPSLAGLGTHLTLSLDGSIKFGPDVEHLPHCPTLADPWSSHLVPSSSRLPSIISAVQRYLPNVSPEGFSPDQSGIRPKTRDPASGQTRDFEILHDFEGMHGLVNLLGIESPGLTAAMGIAEEVERRVAREVWGAGRGRKVSELGGPGLEGWA